MYYYKLWHKVKGPLSVGAGILFFGSIIYQAMIQSPRIDEAPIYKALGQETSQPTVTDPLEEQQRLEELVRSQLNKLH